MSRSSEDKALFVSVYLHFWELNYGHPNRDVLCSLLWIWSRNPQQFSQNREINYSEFLSDTKHASFLVLLCHLIMGYWFPLLCISENSLGNALVICSKWGTSVIFWQAGERNTACLSSKTLSTNRSNSAHCPLPLSLAVSLRWNWLFRFVHESSEIQDNLLKNAI